MGWIFGDGGSLTNCFNYKIFSSVTKIKSYDRSFKGLNKIIQDKTISALDALIDFLKTGQKPKGLGLKKMFKNYWEIRLDIRNRIIFEYYRNTINIAFVGDHNAVW